MKYLILLIGIVLILCSCGAAGVDSGDIRDMESVPKTMQAPSIPEEITPGSEVIRGFVQDNIYHSPIGDIHYSSAYPEPFYPNQKYGLFISLPGWEGLYFQGVGSNMGEDFAPEARNRDDQMIVLCPQLSDWGETSARGYEDQHGGGNAFAKDEEAMGWLFRRQRNGGIS